MRFTLLAAILYLFVFVICYLRESIRIPQIPGVIGFFVFLAQKIVATIEYETYDEVIIDVGNATVIFGFLSLISLYFYIRLGEQDFSPLKYHSGPFGVASKTFWTRGHQNHVILYYPISMDQWLGGFEKEDKCFKPYFVFGDK